ncbi:DNA-binding transcriptional regulator YbjK [Arthrobacter silviterrae]|uniref:Uncharacterized protein n=1 Tax=Arthrobacter silviterrae TaxID=2026658 RepID=A0ABX0DE85_9MICC|nr:MULTISPECIES: hypothetical protein [Arthrobacter]MCU6480219.1 hypothetical protein [Arthrobacter sp. A2-55]MDQ0276203.1 DNA-binding transcriptional regulator YbjK [Arthrobacter silviterrae]NGN82668.1 hypothetical protein [Arthrobacter silviterrae]
MPWWFWIVLWIALTALSLLFVAALGFKVWRDATKTMHAATAMGDALNAHWDDRSRKLKAVHVTEPRTTVPGAAVFATPEQMKDDYLAAKEERQLARLQRRVARRKERGQLQSLRDIKALEDVG